MKTQFGLSSLMFWILIIALIGLSVDSFGQKAKAWVAPASANALKNPFKGDQALIEEGKKLFVSMCAICHGESGKGNGAASVGLETHPANFLSISIEQESDGAIFWKLTEGRPPMASYKTLLSETQRWKLVTYIRKLEAIK